MKTDSLSALSPVDGRYAAAAAPLRAYFSEAALIRERIRVEALWFARLADPALGLAPKRLPRAVLKCAAALARDPGESAARAVKTIERRIKHDVKAVEYFVRDALAASGATGAAGAALELVHFGCTSEDINNLSYARLLKAARASVLVPELRALATALRALARQHAELPMLARTHGQSATPTTAGKELANVAARLHAQRAGIERVAILGKMNGAVGNFNAHVAALPQVDWIDFSRGFVESLGLTSNSHTTQIEPHDWIAEYCHALMRANTVLLDFARNMWSYISLGYFKQRAIDGEVGSSTMPHKVNPIDFENAEGNLGLANALLGHFADKLPVSRLQRDLTDSTVLRNLGVAIGHSVLSYGSLKSGLGKIELDAARAAEDLDEAWEVLGEAVQTVMRAHGIPEAYDRLKSFSRGRRIDKAAMREFIDTLALPAAAKERLLALEPRTYLGLAPALAVRKRKP